MDSHKFNNNLKSALLGLQHLLAMYSGSILVPLLVGTALNFNSTQMTYLVSIDILMCGLATLLQLQMNRFFGIGLPVVLGCAIQAVEPLKMIGSEYGIQYMYGAIILAGIFVFLIAGVFSKIRRLFPPIVTGTLITMIGLSLMPVAFQNIGGGNSSAEDFANPTHLLLGFLTVAIVLAINVWGKGFFKSIAVLIGLVVGTVLAGLMGQVSLQPVAEASWLHFPQLFYFGAPKFEWSSTITMILVLLTTMVETTGVYFALSDVTKQKLSQDDLKRGYRAEGLSVILGGLFNTFPYTTFSQNVGLLQLSGIRTRRPIYYAAGFLILLGFLPKFGALATIIPSPVLGGAMLVMFGMVAVQGIKMLKLVDFNNEKNLLIVAVSLGLGLGVTSYPHFFNALPQTFKMLLSNGIVIAILSSVILNLLFNGKKGLDHETTEAKNPPVDEV
ncbi:MULTISPECIES: nucleobase:cation symporter-2 family protein [Holzapfeliella]